MRFLQHQMNRMSEPYRQAMGHCSFPNYLERISLVLNLYHPKWQCTTRHHLLNSHIKVSGTLIVLEMSHRTITRCPPLHLHHSDRGIHPPPQLQHRGGCHHLTAPGIEVLLRPLYSSQSKNLPTHPYAEQLPPAQVVM
jgi:hypothetical protein